MLSQADRNVEETKRKLLAKGISSGWLVPTETGLKKAILDAHSDLVSFFHSTGLHDYSSQKQGQTFKKSIVTNLITTDNIIETTTSLYRPETKSGDPRIWISKLPRIAEPYNLLAMIAFEDELYVLNTSQQEFDVELEKKNSFLSAVIEKLARINNIPLSDRFSEWNLRLLQSFFTNANRKEEVFLRIDKDLIESIGQDIGGYDGFILAVRNGPSWLDNNYSLVEKSLELVKLRKLTKVLSFMKYKDPGDFDTTYRELCSPAYLPYLAALILTSSEKTSNFYTRFSAELKLDSLLQIEDMKQLEKVWRDLSAWTKEQGGELGLFNVRRLGGYKHIGIPRSQSIVTKADFDSLNKVFIQAEIRAGSDLTKALLKRVKHELQLSSYLFTSGFQKALEDNSFSKAIDETVRSAYLEWDGTYQNNNKHRSSSISSRITKAQVSFILSNNGMMKIEPVWEIPSLKDSGNFELCSNAHSWKGRFLSPEFGYTYIGDAPHFIWEAMSSSFDNEQNLLLKVCNSFEEETNTLSYSLPIHKLWVFTSHYDNYLNKHKLMESTLPSYGSAFLLIPPSHIEMVFSYLDKQDIYFEPLFDIKGIKEDWELIKIPECSYLTDEQRLLPDGKEEPHPRLNSLKLVGGRRITRGSTQMYLPYDLPILEANLPTSANLTTSIGVTLNEQKEVSNNEKNLFGECNTIKRFEIDVPKHISSLNEFTAFDIEGKQIGHVKLRVAGVDGDTVKLSSQIALDNLGRITNSGEGLKGAILNRFDNQIRNKITPAPIILSNYQELGSFDLPKEYTGSIIERFLDAVAISGVLSYGTARNLLQRLNHKYNLDSSPIFILLHLRQLGMLELATTNRGHIISIHSVKPTIIELPIKTQTGKIFGIVGSLRLKQWKLIDNYRGLKAIYTNSDRFGFVGRRLLATREEEIISFCKECDFQFINQPALEILEWANGIEQFKASISELHIESLVGQSNKKLHPGKALFTNTARSFSCELWKLQDLNTYLDNLYVINLRGKLSFIRDSRWGVWLAISEFARWVKTNKSMLGIFPIPLTYSSSNSALWIPARIGLPVIVDRALSLCSGLSPKVMRMVEEHTKEQDISIKLLYENNKTISIRVDCFYAEMASGQWIKYEHVPEEVALKAASLLNARLDYK